MASVNLWLAGAALAALATCAAHVILGGRLFARPLLRPDLPPVVKQTNYYCWHLVTAALTLMAGVLAWAAVAPDARAAGAAAALLAAAFLAVNVTQNVALKLSFARHPQGAFFAIVTALALAGLAYG